MRGCNDSLTRPRHSSCVYICPASAGHGLDRGRGVEHQLWVVIINMGLWGGVDF